MTSQEKPTAAFILSLIGGIIGLIVSFFLLWIYGATPYYYEQYMGADVVLGLWIGFCSLLVVIGAIMMNQSPEKARTWGIIVLIFSVIGLGSILGLIGGILAIVWKPSVQMPPPSQPYAPYQPTASYTPQYPQQITRICPQCGRVLTQDVKFCPYCGKQLG